MMFAWGWEASNEAIVENEGLWNDVLVVNGKYKVKEWPTIEWLREREYRLSDELSIEASIYAALLGPVLDQTVKWFYHKSAVFQPPCSVATRLAPKIVAANGDPPIDLTKEKKGGRFDIRHMAGVWNAISLHTSRLC